MKSGRVQYVLVVFLHERKSAKIIFINLYVCVCVCVYFHKTRFSSLPLYIISDVILIKLFLFKKKKKNVE
jgi:hypothetical protein